jgi:hypothetical protein
MKSTERVRQLSKAGWITQEGPNNDRRYRLLDIVQGYIRFRDDEDRRATKYAAHSRIQDARSREVELKNAQREGRLIELEEAIATVEAIMGMLRLQLSGLPARATRDLQLRRTLETTVNDILTHIADLAAERAKALASRRAASKTIQAERAGPVGGGEQDPPTDIRSSRSSPGEPDPVHHRAGADDSVGQIQARGAGFRSADGED